MKTPGPWRAVPYAKDGPLYPEGTWLVVGPDDDNAQPHTVAVCVPCDDDTHSRRAEADARLIVDTVNAFRNGVTVQLPRLG
jgi:hypothetical protein